MNQYFLAICRIMGIILVGFSFTFLPPIAVALLYKETAYDGFLITFVVTLLLGLLTWVPLRHNSTELRTRHSFILVTLFWSILSLSCALPFYLTAGLNLSFSHATFEAVSGFTTTGGTILSNIEMLPHSILFYRTQLQFLGGMGIIVLAVAIMPLLGMGGMALYKAEIPGPLKDDKLTPRIAHTARTLWVIYIMITGACALTYYIGGMNAFDAITHAFSTAATAGFSNYDASIGHFNSAFIEWTAIIFMFIGGINFSLHFFAFNGQQIKTYINDSECRAFFFTILCVAVIVTYVLWTYGLYTPIEGFRTALFHVISMITTTGYTTTAFSDWPSFLPILLIFLSFLGGCAGSTAGGIKMLRIVLLGKHALREIYRLIHPQAILPVRIGGRVVPESALGAVWAFLGIYAFCTGILTLVMIGFGLAPVDAFSAVSATLNITGPGLGAVSSHFQVISDGGLWVLIFAMLLGRLEIFTIFVLLTPAFWRN